MTENFSLMAHLVPRLTPQVENAATDALAYILNRSAGSMKALDDLLREDGFPIEPIVRVETQVSYTDGSRPDIAGYDKNSVTRLLIEAKFAASLDDRQASGYAQLLNQPGPAVLLFIAPERRIPILWTAIEHQMKELGALKDIESPTGVKRAKVIWTVPRDTELQLVLTSWIRLLDRMEVLGGDYGVKSDINQLRGLAQREDSQVFLPIHSEDLSPDFPRRVVAYNQLADDVVNARGVPGGWLDTKGFQATPRKWGYGRYCRFIGIAVPSSIWIGVNHERWANDADTPLWLAVSGSSQVRMDSIGRALNVQVYDEWVPIHLKTGVEYIDILDDVASQLKKISEVLEAHQTSGQSLTGEVLGD